MKISVIHASRSRAVQAFDTYNKWVSNAAGDFEYILSLDSDACRDYYVIYYYVDNVIKICHRPNNSAIEAINYGAEFATGDIFVIISDDTDCPFAWDKLLLEALEGKSDFIAKVNDGHQDWIITMPVLDRIYYERFGYIYPPHIKHLFADTWITHVADLVARKITVDLTFTHLHNAANKGVKDELNIRNDLTWMDGQRKYLEGIKTNFGLTADQIKGKLNADPKSIQWFKDKGVYKYCI